MIVQYAANVLMISLLILQSQVMRCVCECELLGVSDAICLYFFAGRFGKFWFDTD